MALSDWNQYGDTGRINTTGANPYEGNTALSFPSYGGTRIIVNKKSMDAAPSEGEIRTLYTGGSGNVRTHFGAVFRFKDFSNYYAAVGADDFRRVRLYLIESGAPIRVAESSGRLLSSNYSDIRFVGWENEAGDFTVRIQTGGEDSYGRTIADLTDDGRSALASGGGIGIGIGIDARRTFDYTIDKTRLYY